MDAIKNIGCMNGWHGRNPPPEYTSHKIGVERGEAHEVVTDKRPGSCYKVYTCKTCRITWDEDTGD